MIAFEATLLIKPPPLAGVSDFSVLKIYPDKSYEIWVGSVAREIKKELTRVLDDSVISGQTAHPGVVRGRVLVISNPRQPKGFSRGDILVASMTRPEFLLLMKKAGAFITDAGGMLSHAAITARELRKPCIVGTRVATKILKDGDLVEVDANKGIVKKLQRR